MKYFRGGLIALALIFMLVQFLQKQTITIIIMQANTKKVNLV